jgi:exodeoxyribonuclease VII small subunit
LKDFSSRLIPSQNQPILFHTLTENLAAYNITMPEDAPLSFEAGLQQLETIVKEMESGELPLERALELFERGMKLSEACRKQLEEAETRVEVLMRRGGELQPQPFRTEK